MYPIIPPGDKQPLGDFVMKRGVYADKVMCPSCRGEGLVECLDEEHGLLRGMITCFECWGEGTVNK